MMQYSTSRLSDYTADLMNQRAADLFVMKAIGERVVDPDDLPGWLRARGFHTKAAVPPTGWRCRSHKRNRGIHRSRAAPLHHRTTRERHPHRSRAWTGTRLLTGATAAWAGELVQKALGSLTFGSGDLPPTKLVAQMAASTEFVRRGDLDVVEIIRDAAREQSRDGAR